MGNSSTFPAGNRRNAIFEAKLESESIFSYLSPNFVAGFAAVRNLSKQAKKEESATGARVAKNADYGIESKTAHRSLRSATLLGFSLLGRSLLIFLSRSHWFKAAARSPIMMTRILVGSFIYLRYVYIWNSIYLHVLNPNAANSVGLLRVCLWRPIADFENV